jgi:hypothetical protein
MRVYKAARRAIGPEPSPEQATKLAYMLSCLYRTMEYAMLQTALQNAEARIDKLERRAVQKTASEGTNGLHDARPTREAEITRTECGS